MQCSTVSGDLDCTHLLPRRGPVGAEKRGRWLLSQLARQVDLINLKLAVLAAKKKRKTMQTYVKHLKTTVSGRCFEIF